MKEKLILTIFHLPIKTENNSTQQKSKSNTFKLNARLNYEIIVIC